MLIIRPSLHNAVPGLTAGFTTRRFSDEQESVGVARERLAMQEGFQQIASARQVHGNRVEVVTEAGEVPDCDGLVTKMEDLLLTVVSADCTLVLLADLNTGVLGACHSGWRGTVARVVPETIARMISSGAQVEDIRAYVSPCISATAFEVGEEVAEQFDASVVIRQSKWPRPHVDLKAEISNQMIGEGLLPHHIEIDGACTATQTDRFYSYRAEQGTKGRMIGFIGLR